MKRYHFIFFLLVAVLVVSGQSCLSLGGNKSRTSGPAGMFISTNKGEAWRAISSMPTVEGIKQLTGVDVYRLVEDPKDHKTIYWLSRSNGLFYSFDDGKEWRRAASPLDTGFIYSIAIHPNDTCTIYATNGRQVYKTIDCMRSWAEVFLELRPSVSIKSLAFDPFPPYRVYMGEQNGDLLRSTGNEETFPDGNTAWSVVHRFEKPLSEIVFDVHKEGLVYAALREDGLLRSRDHGETWEDLTENFKEYAGATTYRRFHVYPTEAEHIYWISKYGILFSKNAGTDWDPIKLVTPPGSADIYAFAINPQNEKDIYYAGLMGEKTVFYKTEDRGENWKTRKLPSKQWPVLLRVHPDHGDWLYLGFTVPPQR